MTSAKKLIASLKEKQLTIAVAESLTGGLVCAELTSVPGSSEVVSGAIVAYSSDVKRSILGVNEAVLAERGAVDPHVATLMAESVADKLGSDVGIATTGVAGPDKQNGKEVGTVFIACSFRDETTVVELVLEGNRQEIREKTVQATLELVFKTIS